MKRILLILSFLVSIVASGQIEKVIPSRPNPPQLVNDLTNTLTTAQVSGLEEKLEGYARGTTNRIAVIMISTTDGYSIEDVAIGILRNWGIGDKEKNNGIVLLVAKDDHKVRIETGYGIEGAIPDLSAKSIIDNDLIPNFKKDNYYRGIDQAVDNIIKVLGGEYKPPAGSGKKKGPGLSGLIFILIILFVIFAGGRRGGGGRGGGLGNFGTGWLIGSMMSGSGSGGGGWSSGGGGGGGFGGFGGGSGGGGGASGSW